MSKTVRIPSRLYSDLLYEAEARGMKGDSLIAAFCMLKQAKGQEPLFKAVSKKSSHFGLLRKKTSISILNIKKYVPALIDLGLVSFEENGDVKILGNQACKKKYKSEKMIPVEVSQSLFKTAYSVMGVRIHSKAKKQQKRIYLKSLISVHQYQIQNPDSHESYKKTKKFLSRHTKVDKDFNPEVVLSNLGYSKLRSAGAGTKVTKASGHYWKSKLKSIGLIETERRFEKLHEIEYTEFLTSQKLGLIERKMVFKDGWLAEELVSSLSLYTF